MDWELLRDGLSWAMLLGGAAFSLIGGLGLLRMPDLYTRMHAASLTDTLAATLILGGLMIQGGFTLITAKLLLTLFFLLYTSPVSTHALARRRPDRHPICAACAQGRNAGPHRGQPAR